MKKHNIKNGIRNIFLGFGALLMIGCSAYSMISKQPVPDVPNTGYAHIIKLYNPDGHPERTLAGVVHVTGRATVCTDYPREETIKSLDDLNVMEKQAFLYFLNYAIKDGEEVLGYVSIPIGYMVNIWRSEKDPECKYKVQIILPNSPIGQGDSNGADKSIMNW